LNVVVDFPLDLLHQFFDFKRIGLPIIGYLEFSLKPGVLMTADYNKGEITLLSSVSKTTLAVGDVNAWLD